MADAVSMAWYLTRSVAETDLKLLMYDRVITWAKALDAFLAQHNS